jgi:hypothetical protein
MLSIASLCIAVGGCSSDDDGIQNQPVSGDQAAALIGDAVPFILEFGADIGDLLEAVYLAKGGGSNKQAGCVPIPGMEADYFCTDPADGQVCSDDEVNSEWVFDNCLETATDPGTLDGTVTVTASTSTYDLLFALDIDGGSITGLLQVILGECATLNYTNFEIEADGVSNTLNGTNTICPESASGALSVTVNAPGIQRFLMEINFSSGTILIISPSTQEPLYTCVFDPGSQTAYCMPYGDF